MESSIQDGWETDVQRHVVQRKGKWIRLVHCPLLWLALVSDAQTCATDLLNG